MSRTSTRNGADILFYRLLQLNSAAYWFLYLRFRRHLAMSPTRVEARMALEAPWEDGQ